MLYILIPVLVLAGITFIAKYGDLIKSHLILFLLLGSAIGMSLFHWAQWEPYVEDLLSFTKVLAIWFAGLFVFSRLIFWVNSREQFRNSEHIFLKSAFFSVLVADIVLWRTPPCTERFCFIDPRTVNPLIGFIGGFLVASVILVIISKHREVKKP